jgi:hypothetical protein
MERECDADTFRSPVAIANVEKGPRRDGQLCGHEVLE